MQSAIETPRDSLTQAQVEYLLRDAPALTVDCGLEIIDNYLMVLEDIGSDFVGGSITRDSYATLHATADLKIARELDWGNVIVRPYILLSDGETLQAKFYLGAYVTSTPLRSTAEVPLTYNVTGYDILEKLTDPVGEAYSVTTGTGYLDAVCQILNSLGYLAYFVDFSMWSSTLPADRVWAFDDQTTWMTIVNDLLSAIGYQGIWSDWNGQLRIQPYQTPSDRAIEWVYETSDTTSMLGTDRQLTRDFFDAPNRWVIYRANSTEDAAPVPGDGMYVYVNDSDGDTSVAARGRVITRIESIDVADQASLVSRAQQIIDDDLHILATVDPGDCSSNPLHWHFDKILCVDQDLGPTFEALVTSWTLPLDGSAMKQAWTIVE